MERNVYWHCNLSSNLYISISIYLYIEAKCISKSIVNVKKFPQQSSIVHVAANSISSRHHKPSKPKPKPTNSLLSSVRKTHLHDQKKEKPTSTPSSSSSAPPIHLQNHRRIGSDTTATASFSPAAKPCSPMVLTPTLMISESVSISETAPLGLPLILPVGYPFSLSLVLFLVLFFFFYK